MPLFKPTFTPLRSVLIFTWASMVLTGCPAHMQKASSKPPKVFAPQVPERWEEKPVVILSDSSVYRLQTQGSAGPVLEAERITWYWIRKRTPEVLAQLPIFDFETIETPPVVKAHAIFEDGTTWENFSSFQRINVPEEGTVASNRFIQLVSMPRYAAGTRLRLHVKRKYIRPEFVAGEVLRGPFPIVSRHVVVESREGDPVQVGLVNGEGLPVSESQVMLASGRVARVWSSDSLANIDNRNSMNDPHAWYAAVRMAWPLKGPGEKARAESADKGKHAGLILPTWAALGDHYLALVEASMRPSPAIKDFAQSLGQGSDDSLVTRAFAALGKRLRYHADAEKLHAFVPRSAESIFAKGYGDCKEMSLLLHLVLKERGIASRLALTAIPPAGQVSPDYPTLGSFNHVVLAVPGKGGKGWRFVDPTLGQWPAYRSTLILAGRRALLLAPGQSQLVTMPEPDGPMQEITTRNAVREEGGRWLIEGSIELRGLAAQYITPNLQGLRREEKANFLSRFLEESFGLRALSQEALVNEPDYLRIQYTADFTSQYLQLDKGGLSLEAPTLFGGRSGYTTLDLEGPREFKPMVQNDFWTLPKGFTEFEGQSISNSVAKAAFSYNKGEITRRYQGVQAVLQRGDAAVNQFQRDRESLHKASVWRKTAK